MSKQILGTEILSFKNKARISREQGDRLFQAVLLELKENGYTVNDIIRIDFNPDKRYGKVRVPEGCLFMGIVLEESQDYSKSNNGGEYEMAITVFTEDLGFGPAVYVHTDSCYGSDYQGNNLNADSYLFKLED